MKFSDIHIGDKVIHTPKSGKGFGVGTVLSVKKELSQPGQYATNEKRFVSLLYTTRWGISIIL